MAKVEKMEKYIEQKELSVSEQKLTEVVDDSRRQAYQGNLELEAK